MFLDWLLKTEEDNISYDQLTTKDVGTRQIKMVSVKMETCHYGQNTTAAVDGYDPGTNQILGQIWAWIQDQIFLFSKV